MQTLIALWPKTTFMFFLMQIWKFCMSATCIVERESLLALDAAKISSGPLAWQSTGVNCAALLFVK